MGEIANLFALFGIKPATLPEWFNMNERQRLKEFSPFKVRQKISETELTPPISKEYYSKMCETGVHVTPKTLPQGNNHLKLGLVGGFVMREQAIASINDLATNLLFLTVMALKNTADKELFIQETD